MERYRILKKLAEGGSGETYLVWDKHLAQEWVMKCVFLSRNGIEKKEWQEAAKREIEVLKSLRTAGVPMLLDAFYEDDRMCLVMEYMRGISLEEKIKRDGVMSEQEALFCGRQLAGLLRGLHNSREGVIHGDIKPLNLIWNEGRLSLLDFGAAVFSYGSREEEAGRFYTEGYGAPELLSGGKPDRESDIYAFGAVLYYMLTGHRPYLGQKMPALREERPEISRMTEQIIWHCMKNEAKERYHSMEEAEYALERAERKTMRYEKGGILEQCIRNVWKKVFWRKRKTEYAENILLTDGKSGAFVLHCLEEEFFSKKK